MTVIVYSIIVISCACFVYYFYHYRQLNETESNIEYLNDNNIDSITISSLVDVFKYPLIIKVPLTITDKDSINRIIGFIKRGTDYSINHPTVTWVHHFVIHSKKCYLIFNAYGFENNGTYIEITNSDNEVIKTIRNDSLGIYLNSREK